jgi:hypothetical protein
MIVDNVKYISDAIRVPLIQMLCIDLFQTLLYIMLNTFLVRYVFL